MRSKNSGHYAPVPVGELEMQSMGEDLVLTEEDLEEIEIRRDTRWRTRAAGAGLLCLSFLSLGLLGASWRPEERKNAAQCSLSRADCPCGESAVKLKAKVTVSAETISSVNQFFTKSCGSAWQPLDPPEIELACSCDPLAAIHLTALELSLSGETDCLSYELRLPLDRPSQASLSDALTKAGLVVTSPFVASPFAVSMGSGTAHDCNLAEALSTSGRNKKSASVKSLQGAIQASPSVRIIPTR